MFRLKPVIVLLITTLLLYSCSRKSHPVRSTTGTDAKDSSLALKNVPVKPMPKPAVPKVIIVNDSVAHKSVDGRYYYDLMGHRYWRNNKDGKYYLFNKSMYTDDAFKPVNKKNK